MILERGLTTATGTAKRLSAGEYVFSASGTFGGGTVSLDYRPESGADWVPLTDLALTGAGAALIKLAKGEVRVTITGATGPSIDADIGSVEG